MLGPGLLCRMVSDKDGVERLLERRDGDMGRSEGSVKTVRLVLLGLEAWDFRLGNEERGLGRRWLPEAKVRPGAVVGGVAVEGDGRGNGEGKGESPL